MKFLIQKVENQICHDFSFALLGSIRYQNWLSDKKYIKVRYLNTETIYNEDSPYIFKPIHRDYCPIGCVEFVGDFLKQFHNITPKPLNVPEELFHYAGREIFNGNDQSFNKFIGRYFFKSNDKIKGISGFYDGGIPTKIPEGNYQISDFVPNIISEWRAFVYMGKLVGLQNYSGDFTKWPNHNTIKGMIGNYKSAPIAYTLDVGISDDRGTFVIECHDFFSCGLYGFADYKILPQMFNKWFREYTQKSE